jgi:hypothetical protein
MKSALSFIVPLIFSLIGLANAAEQNPPAEAKSFNGKKYLVYEDRCSWKTARERCKQLGGQLVVIHDKATQEFITTLANGRSVWLGATDEVKEGRWVWVDGTEMDFRHFHKGEPNNANNKEHMAVMTKGGGGRWSDVRELNETNYVCEWPDAGISLTPSAKPAGDRIWSQAETGKTITATLMGKSPDNSNVTLLIKGSPKTMSAAADTFSREDREYIANWVPSSEKRVASDPNPTGAKSEQSPQGLVLRQPTVLDQGKGGFGIQIDELGEILKPYGEPENDLAAHPGLVIYSGPAPKGGSCRITYLMKRAEAVEQLLGRTGLTMKLNPVLPGFPPGLSIYNYDRKFGDYDHMTLVVDDADQVVTLQFKSDSKAFGFLDGKWPIYNFKTLNYINLKAANGGRIQVRGRKNREESVLVNIDHRSFRETVTWYVPKPLVRLILFNVREKQKVRK